MDNSTMLGKVVKMLVTVPVDMLGSLVDICEKLASDKGAEWYENFRKFLRKETCWANVTAQAATETIRTMLVDPTKGFKTLLAECANDWFNDDITEKRFPITAEDSGEWEYYLWDPKGSVSSPDAIERMKGDDSNNPWMPARLAHLLVFGKLNPDAQRSNPIIALGSVGKVRGNRYVPYLYEDSSGRNLYLRWWGGAWSSYCRFLAVRKVKKS